VVEMPMIFLGDMSNCKEECVSGLKWKRPALFPCRSEDILVRD
jgi:hypothetical protein